MKNKRIGLIVGGLVIAIVPSAQAMPYEGNTVYRAMDGDNEVVVFSQAPGSVVSVNAGQTEALAARIVDACGTVRISSNADGTFTGLKVDGVNLDASTLPVQTLPSCVNGTLAESRNENFRTPTNQVVIVGKTPGLAVSVSSPSLNMKTVRVNSCGFGILRDPGSAFTVGSTNYTTSELPNASLAPFARTVNGSPVCYTPRAWDSNAGLRVYKTARGLEASGLEPGEKYSIEYAQTTRFKRNTMGTCNYLMLVGDGGPYPKFRPFEAVTNIYPEGESQPVATVASMAGIQNSSVGAPTYEPCDGTQRNVKPGIAWNSTAIPGAYIARSEGSFYIVGLPQGRYEVTDGRGKVRSMTANACGILRASFSTSWPASALNAIKIKDRFDNQYGNTYQFSSVAERNPDLCRGNNIYLAP